MSVNILIADDHDIIREGIKSVLSPHPEYKVVSEAKDGDEVLSLARKIKPDVLLLDITMPKIGGLDVLRQIRHISPATKIIIITVHKMGAYVISALQLGVNGYINKDSVVEELLPALTRVLNGGVYLGAQVSQYLAQIVDLGAKRKPGEAIEMLSKRELDILRLVAEGKTAKEIAEVLFLSRRTVENYKNVILKKLNLRKTSDLIKYALEKKLFEAGDDL